MRHREGRREGFSAEGCLIPTRFAKTVVFPPAGRPAPASIAVTVRPPAPSAATIRAPATLGANYSQPAEPSVSYGAWVAANPGMTRRARTEGLRKFMQARDPEPSVSYDDAAAPPRGRTLELNMLSAPTSEWVGASSESGIDRVNASADLHSISCAKQPITRAERVAQIQRSLNATRHVDHIDYLQEQVNAQQAAATAAAADPIVVSPLPAGWTLSQITGLPVFSYGEWSRSRADTAHSWGVKTFPPMDRVTAARQFIRYSRQ